MRHNVAISDSIMLPPASYLIVKEKGYHTPFTQMINAPEEQWEKVVQLPGTAQGIFTLLSQRLQYDHIAIITVDELSKFLHVGPGIIYRMLNKLRDENLIRKVAKNTYKINPSFIWKGKSKDRAVALADWNNTKQEDE